MKLLVTIAAATAVFIALVNAQPTSTTDVYDYVIVGGGVGGNHLLRIAFNAFC